MDEFEPQPEPQEPPVMASKSSKTVPIKAPNGTDTGIQIKLGSGSGATFSEGEDPNGLRALADRVESWNEFQVDGEIYAYGEGQALALLNRFPWMAEQIKDAA